MSQNLIQPLIERANNHPNQTSLILLHTDGSEQKISARDFHLQNLAFAAALQQLGVGPEDLVILVLKHSQTLLSAFWGAMYLGAIPSIFPFLTEKLDPQLYMQRVRKLVEHSEAKAVITFPEFYADLSNLLAEVNCKVLSTAQVPEVVSAPPDSWGQPEPEKIAFLQHSSGTTGLQKGVALSHRSVIHQIDAYSQALELQKSDVVVSWLPLYHDMGLIAGFVLPLYTGTPLVLMSPFHWVRDPKLLLQAIDTYKGTLCWLPNFAYNHLARAVRPSQVEGLDLSSLRAVVNCSEPAYEKSHSVFLEKFTRLGLKENALTVCYAMAENTFAVTQTPIRQAAPVDWVNLAALQERQEALPEKPGTAGAGPVVSCGFPIEGTEVAILGNDGNLMGERRVGEILVRSNCMLTEYYRRPEITKEAIVEGWYHTGDMGYMADGELFVTGRKKDLIIVGGKNIYPQDLEAIANHIPGIYPGRAVAFGLYDDRLGSESVVLVCELLKGDEPLDKVDIERELRRAIVEQTEVTISDLRLVEERWLIKTSSGKMARADNREKYIREFRKE